MKKKVLIQEAADLLSELAVLSKNWPEGSRPHQALVKKFSEVSKLPGEENGALSVYTTSKGRLIPNEKAKNYKDFNTFDEAEEKLRKLTGFSVNKWNKDPPYESGNFGSEAYDCFKVVVKQDSNEIKKGTYVVPFAVKKHKNKEEKQNISVFNTDKIK